MSEQLPDQATSTGAGTAVIELLRDIAGIGPSGVAISVLILIIALFGWIIVQQTKTILSIREMTTETDRQVASSLQAIGSQLGTIQFMLMHGRANGDSHEDN